MAENITDSYSFSRHLSGKLPVVAKFGSKTCGPCVANGPAFSHAGTKYAKKLALLNVDVNANSDLSQKYGIRSMPTFIYFVNGTEQRRVVGASSFDADVASFAQKYGRTVFEQSQGHSLAESTTSSSTIPAASTTTASTDDSGKPQRSRAARDPNNPWAKKGFNPGQQMKLNREQIQNESNDSTTETTKTKKVICDGNSCRVVEEDGEENDQNKGGYCKEASSSCVVM